MMIKPWLIRIVGKTRQYIAVNVLANWIGLLANVVVIFSIGGIFVEHFKG